MSTELPSQQNRPIRLTAPEPYGESTLLLRAFHLDDELSRPFELKLEIQSLKEDIDFDRLIGQAVTVTIDLPTNQKRYLRGTILEFEQTGFDDQYSNYTAVVVPWFSLLKHSVDCRVFENVSVPDLAMQIFKDRGFTEYRSALTHTYPARPFIAQYNESDFHFISRLFENVGIYYYFEQTDKTCTLVLCDADTPAPDFPGYATIPYNPQKPAQRIPEHIYEWRIKRRFEPKSAAVTGYDYQNPRQVLKREIIADKNIPGSEIRRYKFEDSVASLEESEFIAQVRSEEIHSDEMRQTGVSDARGLCVGCHFSLTAFPRQDQNTRYLIASLDWKVTTPPFTAQLSADTLLTKAHFGVLKAKKVFRPARITPKKRIVGPQTAVVIAAADEKSSSANSLGSVRVRFPWASANSSSCWVRVSQPWASKGWGAMFIPSVGDEVVVSFTNGDPDLPLITGRVYNADRTPAENPETHPDTAAIQDVSGNYIKMTSTKGEENISLFTPNNATSIILGPEGIATSTTASKNDQVEEDWKELTMGKKLSLSLGAFMEFVGGFRSSVMAGLDFSVNLISRVALVEAVDVSISSTETIEASKVGAFRTVPTALKKIGQRIGLVEKDIIVAEDMKVTSAKYDLRAVSYNLKAPKQTEGGGSSTENWLTAKSISARGITLDGSLYTRVNSDVTTTVQGSVAVNITGAIINIG